MRSSFNAGVQQPGVALVEGVEALRFQFAVDQLSDAGLPVDYSAAVEWADDENRVSPLNRGDGQADRLCGSDNCTFDDQVNTVMVKASLLVRAPQTTPGYSSDKIYYVGDPADAAAKFGPFTDEFKRHVYASSMRLVNVSARRETP